MSYQLARTFELHPLFDFTKSSIYWRNWRNPSVNLRCQKNQLLKIDFQKCCNKIFDDEKNFFFKQNFLGHAPCLKSPKMNFYDNRTTDAVSRLPYVMLGNLQKTWKIPTFWDILQWAPSYGKEFDPPPTENANNSRTLSFLFKSWKKSEKWPN